MAAISSECMRFEKKILANKYGNDALNLHLIKVQNSKSCTASEAVRIMFDTYVADILETSFTMIERPDTEDRQQNTNYHPDE